MSGDRDGARHVAGKLMEGDRDGSFVTPDVAQALAKAAADFDTRGPEGVGPRRASTVRRPIEVPPSDLLSVTQPTEPLLVLPPVMQRRLDGIVHEHERTEALAAVGLTPTSRLLLTGPPGVGKTLTATWLAARLGRPLARVEPALVMSSLLGESARNLRQALDWGRRVPSVLLIDEFDAFAKRRDDPTDIGELKRLVNMLLLELDSWPSTTLLIAATNHPQLLDSAMRRRFEVELDLPLPDARARAVILTELLTAHHQTLPADMRRLLVELTEDCSASDVRRLVMDAVRRSVTDDAALVDLLLDTVRPPSGRSRDATVKRAMFCAVAHDQAHLSNREIAALLEISNSTVSDLVHNGRSILASDGPAP